MFAVDLHIHTWYSDGRYSPEQQLHRSGEKGLKTIAFTDHDTADAARHIRDLSPNGLPDIEVIPAIEFTTSWPDLDLPPGMTDVDLLAYFVDLDCAELIDLEKAELKDISQRISDGCERLTEAGYPLTMDDVWAENHHYPSQHSLIAAILHKGYADAWEAGERLMFAAWEQVHPCKFKIGPVIETIHAAGGVAVLAHPAAIAWRGGLIQAEQVGELFRMGLDGIEVYHHRNDETARQRLLALAQRFGLLVSGGSDEHGWWHDRLGTQPVTVEMLDALRARHVQKRIEKEPSNGCI